MRSDLNAWLWVLLLVPLLVPTTIEAEAVRTPHAPIHIEGDAGWTAANGVRRGSGTSSDPYVLEGWVLAGVGAPGILVRNTTAHAIIRDNEFLASYPQFEHGTGILLRNVQNVTVSGNTFLGNNNAVRVERSRDVTITMNHVAHVPVPLPVYHRFGFNIRASHHVTVTENVLADLDYGMMIRESTDVRIEKNQVSGIGAGYGIGLDEVDRGRLANNTVNSSQGGLGVWASSHLLVLDNRVGPARLGILIMGISLEGDVGRNNTIMGNVVTSIGDVGIHFVGCTGCLVAKNLVQEAAVGVKIGPGLSFENNTITGTALAIDHATARSWQIRNNALEGNTVQLQARSGLLDARWNWFGSANGPAPESVVGMVRVDPWSLERPSAAPVPKI